MAAAPAWLRGLANAPADASGAQPTSNGLRQRQPPPTPMPVLNRVVPENVTLLPKTKDLVTGGNQSGKVSRRQEGDSVNMVLRDQAPPEEAKPLPPRSVPAAVTAV